METEQPPESQSPLAMMQQQQEEDASPSGDPLAAPSTSTILPLPSTATLIEHQVFYPPTQTIGSGANTLRYTPQSPAWHCAFSTNGEWLAACFGAPAPCIRLWRHRRQEGQQNNSAMDASTAKKNQHSHRHKQQHDHTTRPDPNDFTANNASYVLHSTLDGIHPRTIRCVAFCPLANKTCILAAASFDATVTLWEYNVSNDQWECTTQLEGHENEVKYVAWNATGSLLATCGRDKTVWIWETFLDGTIGGSSANELDCIAVLNGHEGDVKCVQFAPSHQLWGDGDEILLSASYDHTIKVWAEDAGDWYCACTIATDVHRDTIWSLALSPGGGRLVSASADGSLAIWKSYTPAERQERFPDLLPNNNNNSTSSSNGLWKCVGTLDGAHSSEIYSVAYAPAKAGHGRIASSGADNRIQIYREVPGSTSDKPMFDVDVAVDTTHGDVNCVCWHPRDGTLLCSAGDDGTVRIWKFEP